MPVASDSPSPDSLPGDQVGPSIAAVIPRRSRRWRWLVVMCLLTAVAGAAAWTRARSAGRPIRYETAAVRQGPIVSRVTANGNLSARVTVQVGSQISGRIQELLVDFNSPVRRGQILARLDPELSRAAVEAARANLAAASGNLGKARARLAIATRIFDRTRALVDRNLVALAELDGAEAEAHVGRAEVEAVQGAVAQARAALHQAEVNLGYTTIRSPVDGVVISRSVDVGQTVAASLQAPTLFTIAEDLTKMQVHTNVPEADIGKLRPGLGATFTVDAFPDDRFVGVVQTVRNASQVTQNVVTYDAVVDVDNSGLRLRPGMTATVTFVVADKPRALTIPLSALRFLPRRRQIEAPAATRIVTGAGQSRRTIYVLAAQRPRAVDVELGISDGTSVEILSGKLRVDDPVIVDERSEGRDRSDRDEENDKPRRLPRRL